MAAVEQIHGGWGSFTFLVDDHILRFARTAEVAAAHHREAALLPLLAARMPFRVPEPDFFGSWGDASTCLGYPAIEGRAITGADDWRGLAAVLRALHAFPVDTARDILGVDGAVARWRADHQRLWEQVVDQALPVLDADLRTRLTSAFTAFLGGDRDFTPTFVHGDLAPEHVLVDDTGRVVGLIDFEDATVGDPAIDFAGLLTLLGPDRIDELLAAYGAPVHRERLRCYWWLAPVHDLLHGLTTHDRVITAEAMTTLRERLP
jgi:aminoglycoside 2''-phosphotransferase